MKEGSIIENQGGWQWWYEDPRTGKRKARMLYIYEDGEKRAPKNMTEAKVARAKLIAELEPLAALKRKEQVVLELATTRKAIAALEHRPSELWELYTQSMDFAKEVGEGRRKYQRHIITSFTDFCQGQGISTADAVTAKVIADWLNSVTKGKSARTYNEYLLVIRQVLSATGKAMGLDENPASSVPLKHKETLGRKPFTLEEVGKILDCFRDGFFQENHYLVPCGKKGKTIMQERVVKVPYTPDHLEELHLAVLFGVMCGMRMGDAVNMRWKQIDLDNRTVSYTPSKTRHSSGARVEVPIVDERLQTALKEAKSRTGGEGLVTPGLAAWHKRNASQVSRTFLKLFSCALGLKTEECGEGRERAASLHGFHALRHTFVSFCVNADISLEICASIVGHSTIQTTQIYSHVNEQAKRKALGRVFGSRSTVLREQIGEALAKASTAKLKAIAAILGGK